MASNELFHFVGRIHPADHDGNYELLKKVIEAGTVSHPPHDIGWGGTGVRIDRDAHLEGGGLIVPTVTCFCDIRFEDLAIHTRKYGRFGLSFRRDLLVKYGARPVIYVPTRPDDWKSPYGASLLRTIEQVFRSLGNEVETLLPSRSTKARGDRLDLPDACHEAWHVLAKDFLAFLKPFDSTLAESDENNFYMEREWRKFGNLCFEPSEVGRVVVEQEFLDRARHELSELAERIVAAPI